MSEKFTDTRASGRKDQGFAKHAKDLRRDPDRIADLFGAGKRRCESIEICGVRIAQYFSERGWTLISLSIFHEHNAIDPYHIYVDAPEHIMEMCADFQFHGGCPIAKEAMLLAQPFDVLDHDFSAYEDDLSRDYCAAFRNLGHSKIITVPVQMGGGVQIMVLGGDPSAFHTIAGEHAAALAYQLMVNMAAWFPETRKHFEPRNLTWREAQILSLTAGGLIENEIANRLDISPNTVRTHIENVKRKLNARNKAHAVALAIEAREISEPMPHFPYSRGSHS